MISILLVEDDPSQLQALEEYLSETEFREKLTLHCAASGSEAQAILSGEKVDLIICDLMLPDTTGIDIIRELRKQNRSLPFLILTAQPTIESAVDAIQAGANDYLTKPVDFILLKKKLEQLIETIQLKSENSLLKKRLAETFTANRLIGSSNAIQDVITRAEQVASTDITVLIEGESGTGKELFANLIHENSARTGQPFVKVNCGALTKTILESELFGVVKGAFTGAAQDRPGYFEAANGGTIFLDEIGEMDLESQVRLLRVIEEREVVRVGSTQPRPIDVRIIAAGNRTLLNEVDAGSFREDLYYRLSVIRLALPPLRERKSDLPLLFNHYVTEFNEKYQKSVTGFTPELLAFFQNYHWPGNIRQFRNVMEGMVILAREDILTPADLPDELRTTPAPGAEKFLSEPITPGISLQEYEKAIISKNLAFTSGNREKTAELLGISERTLYRKIKEYNL